MKGKVTFWEKKLIFIGNWILGLGIKWKIGLELVWYANNAKERIRREIEKN